LAELSGHPLVGEVRGVGLIAAVELAAPADTGEKYPPGNLGARMSVLMQQNGLISRNMVDAMAFCPPLIVSAAEVNTIINVTTQSLEELTSELGTDT
jgi:4-aminobutyrate--pyruvate transaminase